MKNILIIQLIILFSIQSCKKTDTVSPSEKNTVPIITKFPTVSNISNNSVKLTGIIDGNGGTPIKEHIFFVIDSASNQITKQLQLGAVNGPFPFTVTQEISGLKSNNTYKVSFVAVNSIGGMQVDTKFKTAN